MIGQAFTSINANLLQNVSNNFRFSLEKCIEANSDTFEQELQECPKFHNDVHLSHGYARF
jgi:hypothetical protein